MQYGRVGLVHLCGTIYGKPFVQPGSFKNLVSLSNKLFSPNKPVFAK
jgi:hypothetical protein